MKAKKVLALLLSLIMAFSLCNVAVFAEETPVAKIGIVEYETLAEAISAAKDGDTVTLMADTAVSTGFSLEKNLTLDLAGKTITTTAVFFNIYGNYELTIMDSANGGAIDANADKIVYVSGGKLILEDGALIAHSTKTYTYGVQVGSSGSFEMNGGSITIPASSTSTYNYCISNSGTTVINDGNIVAEASGGNYAVNNTSGTLTVAGGSITAHAYAAGFKSPYALYITGGTASVSGGYVKAIGDSATYSAGYLIDGNGSVSVTGGYFGGSYYYGIGSQYIAEGYEVVTLTDNEADPTDAAAKAAGYKFKAKAQVQPVAEIDGTQYASLADAIAAADDGDTIELLADIVLTSEDVASGEDHFFEITKNITIDGKGHSISATYENAYNSKVWYLFEFVDGENNVLSWELKNMTINSIGIQAAIMVNSDSASTLTASNLKITSDGECIYDNGPAKTIMTDCELNHSGYYRPDRTTGINRTYFSAVLVGYSGEVELHDCVVTTTDNGITTFPTGSTISLYNTSVTVDNTLVPKHVDETSAVWAAVTSGYTHELAVSSLINIYSGSEIFGTVRTTNTDPVKSAKVVAYAGSLFSEDIEAKENTERCGVFVDDGCEVIDNNDGTWTVVVDPEEAVAKIGNTYYLTLADAIAAANELENATVTLLRDYDMEANEPGHGYTTSYVSNGETTPRNNMIEISGNGLTFDLGGHTLSNLFNNTFTVTGTNVTVQNGAMELGQLYYGSYSATKGVTLYASPTYGSYVMYVSGAENFVVNNLTTFGGINVAGGSTAKINNLSFSGLSFYAVCAQGGSVVTLNGGSYNKAITGAANYLFWVQSGSTMNITDGTYTKGTTTFVNGVKPVITGGVFDFDPKDNGVAEGYEAVALTGADEDKYKVGKVKAADIALAGETTENYDATYTATKQVISTDGGNDVLSEATNITVNVKAETEGTAASDTELEKFEANALQDVISEVIEAANPDADTIEVLISVVSDEGTENTQANTITYEVHPVATAFVNNVEVGTVEIGNEALAEDASFKIVLSVPVTIADVGDRVKVSHISEDGGNGTEIGTYVVREDHTIELTVTHFSKFELAADDLGEIATARYSTTLTLNNNIDVNFYVFDITGDANKYSVEFTFGGRKNIISLANATYKKDGVYGFVAASCRAEQMGDIINIVVKYNGKTIYTLDYSVKTYCENQIKKSSNQNLVELCKSTLEYGEYAQRYFNYKTDALVTENYSANKVVEGASPIEASYNKSGSTNEGTAFSAASVTLTLASETEVNFYFKPIGGKTVANYDFIVTKGGETVDDPIISTYDGWIIGVTVKGFAATQLNDEVVVTAIDRDTGAYKTINYSPLSYAYRMQNKESTGTLCQALYYYYQAAKAYFS